MPGEVSEEGVDVVPLLVDEGLDAEDVLEDQLDELLALASRRIARLLVVQLVQEAIDALVGVQLHELELAELLVLEPVHHARAFLQGSQLALHRPSVVLVKVDDLR